MDDKIENNATVTGTLDGTPYEEDVPKLPEVHTGGKKFVKVGKTTDSAALSGAEFKIFKAGTTEYLQTDWSWGSKATARVFTSGADGKFEVTGLAYGDYTLEETKAPTGYNLRADVNFRVGLGSYDDDKHCNNHQCPYIDSAINRWYGYDSLFSNRVSADAGCSEIV
jgi:uncharacterized surface anchored protein